MAVNFSLVPTRVIPYVPKWDTDITPGGNKKQYQSMVSVPEERFKLVFEKMSDANWLTLIAHYNSCLGGFDNFIWDSVPDYVDTNRDGIADGGNMTGRWEEGSVSEPVMNANDVGDIEVIFIKDLG